jgi:hypothetical protein
MSSKDDLTSEEDLSEYLPSKIGLTELAKQANAGDPAALAALRKTLDENPQIWQAVGNLSLHARMVMVDALAGGDLFAKDSLMRHAADMEKNLAGPSQSALERLAVQRIVACWMETHYAALQGPEPTGNTLKHAKFALQLKESAEKRFHAAIKSLTLIRKMLPSNAVIEAKPAQDTTAALVPSPITTPAAKGSANGKGLINGKGSTNGNGSTNGHRRSIPPVLLRGANSENGHVPANRIAKHLPKKANGHAKRLRVFSEDAVSAEKQEAQPT